MPDAVIQPYEHDGCARCNVPGISDVSDAVTEPLCFLLAFSVDGKHTR